MSDNTVNPFECVLNRHPKLERALVRYAHLMLAATSPDDLLSLVCVCDAAINGLHARRTFEHARKSYSWQTQRYLASSFLHFQER